MPHAPFYRNKWQQKKFTNLSSLFNALEEIVGWIAMGMQWVDDLEENDVVALETSGEKWKPSAALVGEEKLNF